ncbi:MAG TPA: nickel pincer cofactor biosynthesis protein LarB [Gemmatimonadaceae bacterium]|nr:nickel pincer cofactor biosynthesis protein LarB [Gemmatimonadaceae bacterium]
MIRERARTVLADVAAGRRSPDDALDALGAAPFEELGFATLDHHRALRQGVPEVVFAPGKTADEIVAIADRVMERDGGFLVTRVDAAQAASLRARFPDAHYNERGRTVRTGGNDARARGPLLIITAGTSDLAVAEECAECALACGINVERATDVGVAGLHRLSLHTDAIARARAIVVIAGMDGALPSVIGGLARVPVIAVPTSVGYGASFEGLAALLTMLNSCAAGVVVTNIDNGFGAAMAVARLLLD